MDPQAQTGINFGTRNRFGNLNISGPVAGRDVNIGQPAEKPDTQQLIALIQSLQQQVKQLDGGSAGDREDAHDELDKARRAAEEGDQERLTRKLASAKSILDTIGCSLPTAVAIAHTVQGLLVQLGAAM